MTISDAQLARAKNIRVEQVPLLRRSRGTTNETLDGLPDAAIRRALRRLNHPDLPNERRLFRLEQERGDDGTVPAHAQGTALDRMRARAGTGERPPAETAGVPTGLTGEELAGGPTPTAGMRLTRWEWLGPGNIGGRTRGIVIHPGDPLRIWAASAGGGVWHTPDGGRQWAPVDDFLGNLACSCLAMDPSTPTTLYVGTGEGFSNADALRGNGVFRTTDGADWAPITATQTADFRAVTRIAVSRTGEVVLAATTTGLFRSSDAERKTWTRVLDVPLGIVLFDPTDDSRAVAGALDAGAAFVSSDGGRTWHPATHDSKPWSGRVELAYAAKDPAVVYASVQMTSGRIWRSTDGGRTYHPRRTLDISGHVADYLGDQGWYGNAVWAATRRTRTSSYSAASTCGAARTAATTSPRSAPGGTRDRCTPTTTPSSPTRPTTEPATARSCSATTAASSWRTTWRGPAPSPRRRSSTDGPSWTTTTASPSSSPERATGSAERSSEARRTTAPSASTPPWGPRAGSRSSAATAAGAPPTRTIPRSSTASTSS